MLQFWLGFASIAITLYVYRISVGNFNISFTRIALGLGLILGVYQIFLDRIKPTSRFSYGLYVQFQYYFLLI